MKYIAQAWCILLPPLVGCVAPDDTGKGDRDTQDTTSHDTSPPTDTHSGDSEIGDSVETAVGDSSPDSSESAGDSGGDTGTAVIWADPWVSVSLVSETAVALSRTGILAAWGLNSNGNLDTPTGAFTEATEGVIHGCALDASGMATCWGEDGKGGSGYDPEDWEYGQSDPPAVPLHGIRAGFRQTCGLDSVGAVVCWGYDYGSGALSHTGFTAIDVDAFGGCALSADGQVECWGYADLALPDAGPWSQIAVGAGHICALDGSGLASCVGGQYAATSEPPAVEFLQISAGDDVSCGIATDATLHCWGIDDLSVSSAVIMVRAPTSGTYTSVAVGSMQACAITTEGSLTCWGSGETNFPPDPPG